MQTRRIQFSHCSRLPPIYLFIDQVHTNYNQSYMLQLILAPKHHLRNPQQAHRIENGWQQSDQSIVSQNLLLVVYNLDETSTVIAQNIRIQGRGLYTEDKRDGVLSTATHVLSVSSSYNIIMRHIPWSCVPCTYHMLGLSAVEQIAAQLSRGHLTGRTPSQGQRKREHPLAVVGLCPCFGLSMVHGLADIMRQSSTVDWQYGIYHLDCWHP